MPMVVRFYPLVAPLGDLKDFADELLIKRRPETDHFYQHLGVSHESWHVQELPSGTYVICCTEVADVDVASTKYGPAAEPFPSWFKKQVMRLTGVDPNATPLGPESHEVFCLNDPQRDPGNKAART